MSAPVGRDAAARGGAAPRADGAGRLFGVGVGPGDPELITVRAQRVIGEAQVIAYPSAQHGNSMARRIAEPYLREDQIELQLGYPVTTELTDHPGGYEAALADFYDASAEQIAEQLDEGRDVVVLCEGDPFFYGSYMYLHERLSGQYETQVVPGITAFSGAAAEAGLPLVKRDDVLVVVPGTLPPDQLASRLGTADAAVVMKLGRTFGKVREAIDGAGMTDRTVYVERATGAGQKISPLADVEGKVPYMSLLLIPGTDAGCDAPPVDVFGLPDLETPKDGGSVTVVGLGPGGSQWLTPEAHAALAAADDVIGYDTYLARVPERRGQRRHGSDNRVELDRATHALQLAAAGSKVAVVSSGDPGVFAMASAVLEALEDAPPALANVDVEIVSGVSAMQAVAARVGAPLGHDFCAISLSDIRKPWEVIERRLTAAAEADFVIALYNPASKTRRAQLERAVDLLRDQRDPATTVIVARAVGAPEEQVTITTLGELDPAIVDMRTLLIIGSSLTRTIVREGKPTIAYTPRDYPA